MAKETCTNCYVKLPGAVSFCPNCDRPTRHATDAERLDWDVNQWRAHVDRSGIAEMHSNGGSVGSASPVGVIVATAPPFPAPIAAVPKVAAPIDDAPAPAARGSKPKPRRAPRVKLPRPRLHRAKAPQAEPDVVIVLDADHEFAYRACSTCHDTDWIVRTNRNDDGTWNYWCVRCSRLFKTEIKLRYGVKPFLSAGVVIGGLTAASMLMLR